MAEDIIFKAPTPLGFNVRVTRNYWELIVTIKHPVMYGREIDVQDTLQTPDEIRRSRSDSAVHLFYRLEPSGSTMKVFWSPPIRPKQSRRANEYGASKGLL